MGCNAGKNMTVEQFPQTTNGSVPHDDDGKASITRRASEVPALIGDEPQTEMLDNALVNNVQKTPNGLSFDIAFEEDSPESIIRKHPPKRFQRLEEQQTSPNLSLAKLQEKLDEAEIRRQQILQQRVASAKVRKALRKQGNVNGSGDDSDDGQNEDEDLESEETFVLKNNRLNVHQEAAMPD